MEIPSLDIWEKFDDLSLPSLLTDLSFGVSFFGDLFGNDAHEENYAGSSLVHLHEAASDLHCGLLENKEFLYSESNSLNPKDLEVVVKPKCSTVLLDHSYFQNEDVVRDEEDFKDVVKDEEEFKIKLIEENIGRVGKHLRIRKKKFDCKKKKHTRSILKPKQYHVKYFKRKPKFKNEERHHHNSNERQRREDLRLKFEAVRRKVPDLSGIKKASKLVILEAAAEYCEELFDKVEDLEKEKIIVLHKNKILKNQIRMLSEQKKII